jgi:uncharacterized protein (TIGR04141 family)
MTKTRSFSIYLLKEGYNATNALRDEHSLDDGIEALHLPDGAQLLVLDGEPRPPWWRSYFGIQIDLIQASKGALLVLPVADRCFAVCFGHVAHYLLDASYEYDFGIRVTLNSLDPSKLKSTDTLDPGASKRRRTQLPTESDLTVFDFDRDSTILRSLTGKVRDEYKDLFRHATGSSNLRISSDVAAAGLIELCEKLLDLYQSEEYKAAFPEIQNITPVRDPTQIAELNAQLLEAFRGRDPNLNIAVPEIINYNDNVYVAFSGAGGSLNYDDVYMGRYYEYLDQHQVELVTMEIDDLRRHALLLTDEDRNVHNRYSLLKSLVFDTVLEGVKNETFHLSEGNWYRIDDGYIARLTAALDPLCVGSDLPPYDHSNEGDYNAGVAARDPTIVCLDKRNIGPEGQTAVEPCDLLAIRSGVVVFYHIKVSTLSTHLSHLFNQGVNAIELIRLDLQATRRLQALIRERLSEEEADAMITLLESRRYRIVFGIVTRKDPLARSHNLPLFSRISLMRSMKALRLMDVDGKVIFIADHAAAGQGRKKRRRTKAALAAPPPAAEVAA